ncbi:hypothetical protein ACFW1A_39445 [Kitasatospora sp. NPDC058965]|uniref:hypothetical protein n=1 Tax=Kitasatospora sp. NPDC058965 TaxID=3346682 RepID=UPI00369F006E
MRVRVRGPEDLGWWTRAWTACVLAWAVTAGFAVLPLSAGTVPVANAADPPVVKNGTETVTGVNVWSPATNQYTPTGSVSVAPATTLGNQVVHVSWTGFPSSVLVSNGQQAGTVAPRDAGVSYPVRVYQCRGKDPKITDCYGSSLYNSPGDGFNQRAAGQGTNVPDFPSDMQIAVTDQNGNGGVDIEVWTSQQSPTLGCDATHDCSIVVEPNWGGDALGLTGVRKRDETPHCESHAFDRGGFLESTDSVYNKDTLLGKQTHGEICSWANRVVVPLTFAQTASSCAGGAYDFTMAGLPMGSRALQQWRAGACLATDNKAYVGYTELGEPQARSAFLQSRGADVALTALPDRGAAPRPYVYVPLADSGISVVYLVDDPSNGQQIRTLRLNARLLAKELTQSYAIYAPGTEPQSVAGNPTCLFTDPEFLQLNPPSQIAPLKWPDCNLGEPDMLPIMYGGTTDLVHQLTGWIAADPQAAGFLQGRPDEWGMHVDPHYLQPTFSGYPVDQVIPQDSTGNAHPGTDQQGNPVTVDRHEKSYEWNPVLGTMDDAVRAFLSDKPTCQFPDADNTGNHAKCDALQVGRRQVLAIVDSGRAEAYSLPEAQLLNPAGSFVSPSADAFRHTVDDMPLDLQTYTQQLPYTTPGSDFAKDPKAYPLSTVEYAMVPTSGLGNRTTAIGAFFQQVVSLGGGQRYGRDPGQLPVGFADLSDYQRQLASDALTHVVAQDGLLPGNQKPAAQPATGDGGGSTTRSGSGTVAAPVADSGSGTGADGTGTGGNPGTDTGTGGAPAPGATATPGTRPSTGANPSAAPAVAPIAAGAPAPDRAGVARVLLPAVLISGGVLLVGGPAALLLGGTAAGGRLLQRVRRGSGGN